MDSVENAPDSSLWHTLIEADNYHALQMLAYLYPGMVDCIYIDPPYNKPDSHDWKYNCDYVDGTDSYRHSKWLSMIEARLKIAKKLLNPEDSILIVTIDELEYHHLGCLLEQMFPEARIQMVSSVINPKGQSRNGQFGRTDEYLYILSFGKACATKLSLEKCWRSGKSTTTNTIRWQYLRRPGKTGQVFRTNSPGCFYPIFVRNDLTIHSIGESIPLNESPDSIIAPEGTTAIWPYCADGREGCYQTTPENLRILQQQGFLHITEVSTSGIHYLKEGERNKVLNGTYNVIGHRENDNSVIVDSDIDNEIFFLPGTQWNIPTHNAGDYGKKIINNILSDARFTYPKSLYAVHDVIRFFVANKPNALILDFFAGSGTTLHAVNLLNKEDGGNRRCIMVTNNEIGEKKEKQLSKKGIRPGDEEWEKWGIARYVNWPRTKCSILGVDVNGNPIQGEYITSLTETKRTDRNIQQINFLPANANKKQKKALVTFINKQKDVKLPTLNEDVPFLVPEEDDYNASILFDVNEAEAWLEALDGNTHINNLFIVAEKDAAYRRIRKKVMDLLGPIEETIPVKLPMSDGFKANAAFFKLGFLDKRSVARGRQLQELLPLLWMKAGAIGKCPESMTGDYSILSQNYMAILTDERFFPRFKNELTEHPEIEVVYLITDSQNAYLAMVEELKGVKTYQLYRDYLENFRINYATK